MIPIRGSVIGVALALVALAGCGDSSGSGEGASATLVNIQGSAYVTLPPATTTTTTTTVPNAVPDAGTISTTEQSYTVKSGDSVSGIAAKHDISGEALAGYNQWPDGIYHNIFPGDVIRIPPNSKVPSADPPPAASGDSGSSSDSSGDSTGSEASSSGEGCTYTIVKDDNPSKVARKYGITVDELRAANPESVMSTFLIGAVLQIPANGDC